MKRLKNEFDCITLEAAKKKLRTLEKEEQRIKVEFNKAVEEFEEEWAEEDLEAEEDE